MLETVKERLRDGAGVGVGVCLLVSLLSEA